MRTASLPLVALVLASCATAPAAAPEDPAAPARAQDDAALGSAAADLAPLEDHFVAFAGGEFLGGAMLREDAARLLEGHAGADDHAYFFVQGSQGDRRVPLPVIYGPRVAGNGLLQALGLKSSFDPAEGVLTLSRGGSVRTFRTAGGSAAATFTVEPASGLGPAIPVDFVVSSGFSGTALVSREDAAAAGLARSEIPGAATVAEVLTGRTLPCRRALARVTLDGFDGDPEARVSAIVEVLFPR